MDTNDPATRQFLAHHFPGIAPDAWRWLGGGFDAQIWLDDRTGTVVRIARSADTWKRMQATADVLQWIAPHLDVALPVPFRTIPPDKTRQMAAGAVVYRYLGGEPLQPDRVDHGTVEALTAVLIHLHRVPVTGIASPRFRSLAEFHRERQERYAAIRDLLRHHLNPNAFARIERWQAAPVPATPSPTVVHGDFWYENVLVDPATNQVTGVIDWDGVMLGDPAQDLITLRYLGDDIASEILGRYLIAMPDQQADMETRLAWWWANRDFDGVYLSMIVNDEPEIADGIRKLREGSILNP